ncbi:MAG TPA: F0F1 ATP synthase subunit delta [Magnetospirillaceae bacterium]
MASENKGGIAQRYAAALFELAEEKGELDKVAGDLRDLRKMLAESADLRRMIANPVIDRKQRLKAIEEIAKRSGFSQLTANFMGVLIHNGRLFALDATVGAFLALLAAKRGELTAQVSSAAPLAESQIAAVSAALKKALGRAVTLESTVDPSLIGGLVVKVGSRMIDGSLKTKLQRLSLSMKGIG